jgi:hypothetical protein
MSGMLVCADLAGYARSNALPQVHEETGHDIRDLRQRLAPQPASTPLDGHMVYGDCRNLPCPWRYSTLALADHIFYLHRPKELDSLSWMMIRDTFLATSS